MIELTKDNIKKLWAMLSGEEREIIYTSPSGANSVYIKDEESAYRLRELAREEKNYALAKEYNRILAAYELVNKRTVYRHFPMVLQLEHTSICNAECIMCLHYYKRNQDAVNLSDDIFSKLLPIFPYVEEIVLHGNGEPFLLPNIVSVLETYKEFGICVSTNTNMSVLPEGVLKNADIFNSITVSFDSPRKEIYDKIRRNLDFDKVTANIDKFRKNCPDTHMTLAVVSMRQNIYDAKMLVEYAVEHGFNRIMFSRLGINGYINNYYDDVMCYPATLRRCMSEAIAYAKEKGIEIVYPDVFLEGEGGDEKEEAKIISSYPTTISEEELCSLRERVAKTSKRGELYYDKVNLVESKFNCQGICDLVWNNMMITAKGQIIVCCIDVLHHIDMLDKDFMQIWNGEQYVNLRKMFLEKGKLPEFCRNCLFIMNGGLKHLSVDIGDGFYVNKK